MTTSAAASGVSTRIPSGSLQSPSVQEIAVGYAVQLAPRAALRADLVARDWKNFYATHLTQATGTAKMKSSTTWCPSDMDERYGEARPPGRTPLPPPRIWP